MSDDNSQLLNSLIGMLGENPEEKINAVLSSLTGNAAQSQSEPEAKSDSANTSESSPESGSDSMPDLSFLMKIQGLLSQMGGSNDDRSRLLLALKPFLGTNRKPHVDRALQLLRLAKMAEAAKEMDLFKDLKEIKF